MPGPAEPGSYQCINSGGSNAVVLVCDHASNRVPACLNGLGLNRRALAGHIAWDPGAARVARRLSTLLDAPLLLSNYSRLVADCNRAPSDPQFIARSSDGVSVPGNQDLGPADIAQRRNIFFEPYQQAITRTLDARRAHSPLLLSIHSFTARLAGGELRPWPIGVCYRRSAPLAQRWLEALRARVDCPVGDNQPYAVEVDCDHTIPVQAEQRGLDGIMLELRQDCIDTPAKAEAWAGLIARCWAATAGTAAP
ncbi:MAG: N-formylglutamate amidohydrolase [Halieaceae bacterium]|jgi:predicted N-formylglutamate amidohydrolase|nr:N-formylglutamate amidohydrolase [Halieaceae bacterium]